VFEVEKKSAGMFNVLYGVSNQAETLESKVQNSQH
jgi:hypothetical protein